MWCFQTSEILTLQQQSARQVPLVAGGSETDKALLCLIGSKPSVPSSVTTPCISLIKKSILHRRFRLHNKLSLLLLCRSLVPFRLWLPEPLPHIGVPYTAHYCLAQFGACAQENGNNNEIWSKYDQFFFRGIQFLIVAKNSQNTSQTHWHTSNRTRRPWKKVFHSEMQKDFFLSPTSSKLIKIGRGSIKNKAQAETGAAWRGPWRSARKASGLVWTTTLVDMGIQCEPGLWELILLGTSLFICLCWYNQCCLVVVVKHWAHAKPSV